MNLRRHVARVPVGGERITRRVGTLAAAWCRKSYRADLTGWKAGAGPVLRALLLLGLVSVFALLVCARPGLLWLLVPAALLVAWWAGRGGPNETPEERREEESEEAPVEVDSAAAEEAFRQLLRDAIGDRNGVLLRDVLVLLHRAGMHPDWEVADVWSACEHVGVRPRRAVKVGGEGGYGVLRGDLPDPAPAPSPATADDRAA